MQSEEQKSYGSRIGAFARYGIGEHGSLITQCGMGGSMQVALFTDNAIAKSIGSMFNPDDILVKYKVGNEVFQTVVKYLTIYCAMALTHSKR